MPDMKLEVVGRLRDNGGVGLWVEGEDGVEVNFLELVNRLDLRDSCIRITLTVEPETHVSRVEVRAKEVPTHAA